MKNLLKKTKPLTFSLFLVGSLSYAAPSTQASHFELAEKVIQKAERIAKLADKKAHILNKKQLKEISMLFDEIVDVAKYGPNPGNPGRPGGPGNGGPGQPHRPKKTISYTIEHKSFSHKVTGTTDLLMKCMNTQKNQLGNADDIEVSVNYMRSAKQHNRGGWWKGSLEKCAVVTEMAHSLGLQKDTIGQQKVVAFSVEGKESMTHVIQGARPAVLGDKCMAKLNMMGSADDLAISVNGTQLIQKHNRSGWWKTESEICQKVVQTAMTH